MSRLNTLSTRIEEKLAVLTQIAEERCMYKVHEELRDVNEKAYKPVLLAIGPYNDQGEVGQGFMEEYKLRYLQQMLKRTKGSVETYIMALRELEERARKYYAAECINQITPDKFGKMMLLDGCFIIELFHRYNELVKKKRVLKDDPIFQMKWVLPRIARDLLLFENQLPFFVLEKLFKMSKSKEPPLPNESRNLGEHTVDIEEKHVFRDESSTSTNQNILEQLNDIALGFFSAILPFQLNVNDSTERITDLVGLTTHEALNLSLRVMICERLELGLRFKNADRFENLLSLIHATICIAILDTEIDHAKERQEAGVKFKMDKIFGPIRKAVTSFRAKEDSIEELLVGASLFEEPLLSGASVSEEPLVGASFGASIIQEPLDEGFSGASIMQEAVISATLSSQESRFPVDILEKKWKHLIDVLQLEEAGVETTKAIEFQCKLKEIRRWIKIPYAIELQEAGIDIDMAEKFDKKYRNKEQKSKLMPGVESKNAEKLKRLLCKAGVDINKAKKFERLLALEHRNIHGATELEEAGIKFKKSEKDDAFSIKFNNGLMEISPLSIVDETETYLRNLIAYEQYNDQENGFNYVTNFVCFMDDLINSPKDVELLRRSGIIRNYLGDDEVISTMVNKLCHNIAISPKSSIYARTSVDLNMHCSAPWNLRMAKLRHDYFNSPWALVSFLAAVFLLLLTITQTVFSIIPYVFRALC